MKNILQIVFVVALLISVSGVHAEQYQTGKFDYYVLALSWQSAFCEINQNKPECRQQAGSDFSAKNFSLHGLWPNRLNDKKHGYTYCGVDARTIGLDKKGRWCDLNDPYVDSELNEKMPGVQSCLQMHEWVKHGTCSGMPIGEYFHVSLNLLDVFSSTQFATLVKKNVGRTVLKQELLSLWQKEFPVSRGSLALKCRKINGKSYLTEIRIALKKGLGKDLSSVLMKGAAEKSNCARQIYIDEAGFQ